jgi:hypothetical protein
MAAVDEKLFLAKVVDNMPEGKVTTAAASDDQARQDPSGGERAHATLGRLLPGADSSGVARDRPEGAASSLCPRQAACNSERANEGPQSRPASADRVVETRK